MERPSPYSRWARGFGSLVAPPLRTVARCRHCAVLSSTATVDDFPARGQGGRINLVAVLKGSSMEVSVIIAAHNVEKFVGRAIDSVIAQTFRDWEIIVVDDASTDGTARTVEDTGREDPRIRLLRHERNA